MWQLLISSAPETPAKHWRPNFKVNVLIELLKFKLVKFLNFHLIGVGGRIAESRNPVWITLREAV
jgi:hypothetical protein